MPTRHTHTSASGLIVLAGAIFAFCVSATAAEPGTIPVQIFFSKEDPRWPAVEKVVDAVARDYPALTITKTSIDTETGYAELTSIEQQRQIIEPGDVTLVVGAYVLTSKGERRDIETYLPAMMKRVFNPKAGKGPLPVDAAAYARAIFGAEAKLERPEKAEELANPEHKDHPVQASFFAVQANVHRIGWVVEAFAPITCPICNDTHFLVALSAPELKVLDLRPVRELERLGLSLDAKEAGAFTTQFKNLTPKDQPIKVDVISSATKTSLSYQSVVNSILDQLKKREAQ